MSRIKLRSSVLKFAERMERVLRENDYKGGWQDMLCDELISRVRDEVIELAIVVDANMSDEIIKESVDVANFAMMIADNVSRMAGDKVEYE